MCCNLAQFQNRPSPPQFATTDALPVSSRDCPVCHLGIIPFACPADSLVPKQLPAVKAISYREVTFLPLFWSKLTRNNDCEGALQHSLNDPLFIAP